MLPSSVVLLSLALACPSAYDVRDFGANGDRRTNDGPAIQVAIDACHQATEETR